MSNIPLGVGANFELMEMLLMSLVTALCLKAPCSMLYLCAIVASEDR